MNNMKLGLLLMGGIISAIGGGLLIADGLAAGLLAILTLGILLFVLGLLWE